MTPHHDTLQGLLVVEFASVLAGPSVGQFLAELGARVIKIENPRTGGDVTRSWHRAGEDPDQTASYFAACNFGKESVGLDLSKPEGLEVACQLIRRADVVLTSFAPGADERLGLSPSTIRTLNPSVIQATISGYGPFDPRAGYDAVIQAESGFMSMNGHPDGPPTKMPVALVDILAAHHVKEAILLALLRRERDGSGDFLEVSLMDAALVSLANQATGYFATGQVPGRSGSAHPNIAPYGTMLKTKDEAPLLLAVGTDRQFGGLTRILGIPELALDPRFATNAQRVIHRLTLDKLLQARAADYELSDLLPALRSARIPAGAIQTVADALEGAPHLTLTSGDGVRGLRQWFSGSRELTLPTLGAYGRTVLSELTDLTDQEIDHLCDSGILLDG